LFETAIAKKLSSSMQSSYLRTVLLPKRRLQFYIGLPTSEPSISTFAILTLSASSDIPDPTV
jgi:hypothetical protein